MRGWPPSGSQGCSSRPAPRAVELLQAGGWPLLGAAIGAVPALLAGGALGRAARRVSAVRWTMRLLTGAAAVAAVWGGVALTRMGLLPFATGSPADAFERLMGVLERFYLYWDTSPVSARQLRERWGPRVRSGPFGATV